MAFLIYPPPPSKKVESLYNIKVIDALLSYINAITYNKHFQKKNLQYLYLLFDVEFNY